MNLPGDDISDDSEKNNAAPPKILPAEELFQGQREIVIELGDVRYRLRITRRNKLILHK